MTAACPVCGLDPEEFPAHWRLHVDPTREIDADRTQEIERENLALRDALGLPPGGGAYWAGPEILGVRNPRGERS